MAVAPKCSCQRLSRFRFGGAGAGRVLAQPLVWRRVPPGQPWSHRLRLVLRHAARRGRGPISIGHQTTTPTTPSPLMAVAATLAQAIAIGAETVGTTRLAAAFAARDFELPVRTG